MKCRELTDKQPVEWCKRLLQQHPDRWPNRDWVGYPNIIQAVQELLAEAVANPPPPPTWSIPRGVVICGGGWKFFPSLYVTIRVLRQVGCTLPIQVWFMGDAGEFDQRMVECLQEWGVGWIDGHSWWRENPPYRFRLINIDHGWMLKPFAVLGSPFREVLFLDADAYPVYNPERLMDHPEHQRVGATFFPDRNPLEPGQWERFGVAPQNCPGLESGVFIVDKARHWAPLWGTCVLNALHDFTYAHLYGDKDTFNIGWRKAGYEMCVPTKVPGWHVHSFVQKDFANQPFVIHRTRDKFRLHGAIDGQGIPLDFRTRQGGDRNQYVEGLPHEAFCFEMLGFLDRTLRPDDHFDLLGHESHIDEWKRINRQNSYRFARQYAAGDVGLDLGANLGAASVAMLERGIGTVYAVEALEALQERLKNNLRRYGPRANVMRAAVWSKNGEQRSVRVFRRADDPRNTCTANAFIPHEQYEDVPAIGLDELILRATDRGRHRLRVMKIDVEGSEYPALMTCQVLGLVDEIAGEWHTVTGVRLLDENNAPIACHRDALISRLRDMGFTVEWEKYTETHGLFWARQPPLYTAADCCP
jgi:FkbM family methyltransferase